MRITQYNTIMNDDKICQLVKEKSINYICEGLDSLSSPDRIHRMMCDVFQHDKRPEEYVYLLCLNAKCKLQGIFEISHGAATTSICNPREIFQKALLCNAHNIVIVHNHPSGNPTPSKEDSVIYRKFKELGEMMGVYLADSIIVADQFYYSFLEHERTA